MLGEWNFSKINHKIQADIKKLCECSGHDQKSVLSVGCWVTMTASEMLAVKNDETLMADNIGQHCWLTLMACVSQP